MRYLGVDLGSKTMGISISDELGIIASNKGTIRFTSLDDAYELLYDEVRQYNNCEVVFGLPLNLDGSESDRSKLTREFANNFSSKYNIPVHYQDERLSTVEAERMLIDNNFSRKKRKKVIDSIASVIILESFLNKKRG